MRGSSTSPTSSSASPRPPRELSAAVEASRRRTRCAWCEDPLDRGQRLPGRIRCPSCGALTTDPWPDDAELEAAYGDWYRPPSGRFSGFGDALLRRSRASLARRLDRIAPPGPVLDVGSGDGTLLRSLRARGREAVGLERHAAEPGVREGGAAESGGREWAAIVFWHSLEHLRRPGHELEQAASRLMSGGVLIVALPNSASLQARLFGDRWFALDMPRHLVHLDSATLLARLRSLCMEVERISHVRGGQVLFGWLQGLVGALPGRPSLYDAIRRPEARSAPIAALARTATLLAAVAALPLALLGAAVEVIAGRGGTVYVEARAT